MFGGPRFFLMCACIAVVAAPAHAATVLFDFDSGTPPLSTGMGLPVTQTAGGVTAIFRGRFSVQSHDTTFYNLPNFSGNYLVPNDVYSPPLEILFDTQLNAISFDFATADFGLDTNTTLKLTAYHDSKANPPVGSATSQAAGEGWGLGFLAFSSGTQTFNLVDVVILPGAGSDFLADNFTVDALAPTAIPEPATLVLLAVGAVAIAVRRLREGA